jgi:dihydroorotase
MSNQNALTLIRPDDWHVHLRDGVVLADVVPHTAAQFARAIVMPNLKPPVTTTAMAAAYRDRILAAVPQGMQFERIRERRQALSCRGYD